MGFFKKISAPFNPTEWGGANDPITNSALGDLIPGIGDARAQDKANKQNRQLANLNYQWQERMSNTAYQRAMADMKKAGLNPMLAYQQGGASVPSTSPAEMQSSSKTGLSHAVLKAFTGIQTSAAAHQNAQTAATQAQSSVNLQAAQTAKEVAQTQNVQAETALKKRELRGKGVKDTLDREGGRVIQKIIDNLGTSSAKPSVDKKSLEYKHPWFQWKENSERPLIKNKGKK